MYPWQNFIIGLSEHLAWPIVAVSCVLIFKKDINNLLSRIKTLPGGTELNPQVVENQAESKKDFYELYTKAQETKNKEIEKTSSTKNKEAQ